MLSAQKYTLKELIDLQECHTQLKKFISALYENFPQDSNKDDPQYQKFVSDLGNLYSSINMNLFDKDHLQEDELIAFRKLLNDTREILGRITFPSDSVSLQNALNDSFDAAEKRRSPQAIIPPSPSPKKTQHIQEILGSFESARSTLVSISKDAVSKSYFLEKPKGLAQIAYAVNFRVKEAFTALTPIEENYKKTLSEINTNIFAYREGNIKPIQNIIDLIDAFEETLRNDLSGKQEEHQKLLAKLVGIRAECHVIEKNFYALNIQKQLDEISLNLTSEKNKLQLQYDRDLKALKTEYKQNDESVPTSFPGKLFQAINFVADQRKANFLIAKAELDIKHLEALRAIKEHHQTTYGDKVRDLKDQLTGLKGADTTVISPISSASFLDLKSKVLAHRGMTIGNISQSRVNALGSNSGACYGFSKEWVLKMNALVANRVDEHVMIDNLNMYTQIAQSDIERIANQSNVLSIHSSTMKYYAEQSNDKKTATLEYKKPLAINDYFYPHISALLERSNPSSLMINISGPLGKNHAMAVVQDHQGGIWFHDSNFCCIYFSNQIDGNAKENFQAFLAEHMHTKYPEYLSGSFIHVKGVGVQQDMDNDQVNISSSPKSFLPTRQAQKEKQETPPLQQPITKSSPDVEKEPSKPKIP